MKRFWIALAMLAIVIIAGVAEYLYINANVGILVDLLNEADESIEQQDMYAAQDIAERLDTRFSNNARIFDIFMFHSEVTEIGKGLAALRRYSQTGEVSEFLATSARIKRELISMKNSRVPRLENIL